MFNLELKEPITGAKATTAITIKIDRFGAIFFSERRGSTQVWRIWEQLVGSGKQEGSWTAS